MKPVILILTSLFVASAYGDIFIKSYSSEHGPSHLDPINNLASLNLERTGSGKLHAYQSCPAKNNYFLFYERYTDSTNKRTRVVQKQARFNGGSCEEIEKRAPQGAERIGCRAFKTLEYRLVEDQDTGGQKRNEHVNISFKDGLSKECNGVDPTTVSNPPTGCRKFSIRDAAKRCNCTNLPTAGQVKKCQDSGSGQALVVVHADKKNENSDQDKTLFGNIDDTHQCAPPEKTITLPDADWANGKHDSMISADLSGFYIGTKKYSNVKGYDGNLYHTHYAYDNQAKNWCRYSLPCVPSEKDPTCKDGLNQHVAPVCSPSLNRQNSYSLDEKGGTSSGPSKGFTRPMTFTANGDMNNKRFYASAVSLRHDQNGQPYALITALKPEYQGGPIDEKHMDYSKPVVKVSFEFEPIRKTIYETYHQGKLTKRFTVIGSYTFGSQFNESGVCQENTCLNYFPDERKTNLRCSSKIGITVNLGPGGPQEVCYSCNGLTAGSCMDERDSDGNYAKELITAANASAVEQSTLRCTNNTEVEGDYYTVPAQ